MRNLHIGDKIEATLGYAKKCSYRFTLHTDPIRSYLIHKQQNVVGYIVGKRHVIMNDFKFHHDDENRSYVTGDKEMVWLVAPSLTRNSLIVRDNDITAVVER